MSARFNYNMDMQKMASEIILPGRNMVFDALKSSQKLTSVLISRSSLSDDKTKQIEKLARSKGVRVEMVTNEELARFETSSQGVVGLMAPPEEVSLKEILNKKKDPLILLFNRLDYEQNLGAILRSSWATGVDGVVVNPGGVHEITPVVAKVSMGGAAYVPLISQSLFQAMTTLKEEAVPIVGVEVSLGKPYHDENLTGPLALLFGGEEKGLSEPLMKYADKFVHIPMNKEVASLNVSVTTAIVLFERRRQIMVK